MSTDAFIQYIGAILLRLRDYTFHDIRYKPIEEWCLSHDIDQTDAHNENSNHTIDRRLLSVDEMSDQNLIKILIHKPPNNKSEPDPKINNNKNNKSEKDQAKREKNYLIEISLEFPRLIEYILSDSISKPIPNDRFV